MKELYLYLSRENLPDDILVTYHESQLALKNGQEVVYTTQPAILSTDLFTSGYKVYVYMASGEKVELKLGNVDGCKKEIRPGHNLEKLLLANCFGLATDNILMPDEEWCGSEKELHVHLSLKTMVDRDIFVTYSESEKALFDSSRIVHTTQPSVISATWLVRGLSAVDLKYIKTYNNI